MYTECPHCHAIFRVTQAILQAAGGKVRCGECATVFQAVKPRQTLTTASQATEQSVVRSRQVDEVKSKPTTEAKSKPKADSSTKVDRRGSASEQPISSNSSFHRDASEPPAPKKPIKPQPPSAPKPPLEEGALPKLLPIPVTAPRPRLKRQHSALLAPLVLLLVLLLIAQLLVANRKTLVAQPLLRPVISVLCKVSGCEVPRHRDVKAIELLNHGVYSHPTVPGALMIKAMIVNRADFAQPYPVVELGFSNIQGKRVAMRRFGPQEYLDPGNSHEARMPIGKSIPVRLEVVDPGKQALAFEFEFL